MSVLNSWQFHKFEAYHIQQLLAIEEEVYNDPWNHDDFSDPQLEGIVGTDKYGAIIGYCLYVQLYEIIAGIRHTAEIDILSVTVAYSHRSMGMATSMLNKVLEMHNHNVTVQTIANNLPAQKLFRKAGFICNKISNECYRNGNEIETYNFIYRPEWKSIENQLEAIV